MQPYLLELRCVRSALPAIGGLSAAENGTMRAHGVICVCALPIPEDGPRGSVTDAEAVATRTRPNRFDSLSSTRKTTGMCALGASRFDSDRPSGPASEPKEYISADSVRATHAARACPIHAHLLAFLCAHPRSRLCWTGGSDHPSPPSSLSLSHRYKMTSPCAGSGILPDGQDPQVSDSRCGAAAGGR